ncbi:PilX N-terminal domain-containing pilus assembly protein [Thermodesulfobacteriota bacterium B35]
MDGKVLHRPLNNNGGFVLVTAMLIMLVLTLLGFFAINTSVLEMQIARNDKISKKAFYAAEGGLEVGIEVTEQNLSCPGGFTTNVVQPDGTSSTLISGVEVLDPVFTRQNTAPSAILTNYPADTYLAAGGNSAARNPFRDVTFPPRNSSVNPPLSPAIHTNLSIFGVSEFIQGGAIQVAAGYEGKGKGASGGGAILVYDIHSQHRGEKGGEAILRLQWKHLVGYEGDCLY